MPRSRHGNDAIWVIIDYLTKVAHFIPVKTTYSTQRLARLYLSRIVCLHGVPKTIVSNRGTQFVSRFWEHLQQALGTQLTFSTAYHPQTGGQTERVNQILEDMLRACVLTYGVSWEDSLPYAEFSYNNSYQASLKMSLLKPCTDEGAVPHSIGQRPETVEFSVPKFLKKQKQK